AQKVALRYAFIMEKTAAFQGDAERTARGWANMTKRVEGQLTDLAAELGAVLLPAAERLLEHISALVAAFAALSPETKRYLVIALAAGTAVAALAAATGALALALPAVASAAVPVAIAIGNLVGVFAIVAPLVDILRSNWLKSFAAILKDITNWAEGVEKRLESVRGLLDILAPGVVGIRGAKVVTAAMGDFADD
nr:hypothetical protein [Desulfuromonadales bacterium]